jgi:hypothetical protein
MLAIDLMSKLKASIELHLCCKTHLLKKYRNTSPDLQIAHRILPQPNNLLSLAKVSNITIIINSAIEVSRPSFFITSATYQHITYLSTFHIHLEAPRKTLNYRALPNPRYLRCLKLLQKSYIPSESFSNSILLLQPQRQSDIKTIREIKSSFEHNVVLSYLPVYLLPFGPLLQHSLISIPEKE